MTRSDQITEILNAVSRGVPEAKSDLLQFVYDELKCVAAGKLAAEVSNHTLHPTDLVHEVYPRLFKGNAHWQNRRHFFGAAAEAMRRILVDHARKKYSGKRGGRGRRRVEMDQVDLQSPDRGEELLALDEALARLEEQDELRADLVKLKFFAGMSNQEIADTLELSLRSVERYWTFARAWLYREMAGEP